MKAEKKTGDPPRCEKDNEETYRNPALLELSQVGEHAVIFNLKRQWESNNVCYKEVKTVFMKKRELKKIIKELMSE